MNSRALKIWLPVFAWYLTIYAGMYYNLSGKPELIYAGCDTPISFVITGDQSLLTQGRENNTQGPNETQVPVFDLKKNPKIFTGAENFYEPVFRSSVTLLIEISKHVLKKPAVSQLIFPFDYFW